MSSRLAEKEERRRAREQRAQEAQTTERRRRQLRFAAAGIAAAVVAGLLAVALGSQGGGASRPRAQPAADTNPFGPHYAGLVQRREAAHVPTMMQTMNSPVHIHPQLAVFVNGRRIALPANVGIDPRVDPMQMAGLHTHDASGTVHVEGVAGAKLGQFFQIWGVPLSAARLGPYRTDARHTVRMWVDGKPSRAFGNLKLVDGQQIVLSYQRRGSASPVS